jgi:hypothetical protein
MPAGDCRRLRPSDSTLACDTEEKMSSESSSETESNDLVPPARDVQRLKSAVNDKPSFLWLAGKNQINPQTPDDSVTGTADEAITPPLPDDK